MGVNFSPFDIGRRALKASQFGLDVTGQNIANVNTPGYTRQTVQLSPTPGAGTGRIQIGTGVTIDGVRASRDQFIDARLQTETGISGRLTAKRDALSPVQDAFNDTNGSGMSAVMNDFFGSFRDLEANNSSPTLRSIVVDKAYALTSAFNSTAGRLDSIRQDADNSLRSTVDSANTLASQIASLNAQIGQTENTGGSANELRDLRTDAMRQLAELTGARSLEDSNGSLTVTLGDGTPLVSSNKATPLISVATPPDNHTTVEINGQPAVIADGKIKGLSDAIGEINKQTDSLNQLAASIAGRVNELHKSGTDLDSNPGVDFFTVPPGGAPITAANISVSGAVAGNPRLVVASAVPPPGAGTVAGQIANLLTITSSQAGSKSGSFSSIYSSIVSDIGSSVGAANDALTTQSSILAQTSAQRDSSSGVNLDEEAISLLQYQRSYEAAARFLKVADEMTQTILALGQ